jgi:hypothetical protein
MKPIEIESWALRNLERVENHLPVEDLRVELKADWPDAAKTARRLAGHANAARGENILWIIGADEKTGMVTGANYQDLAGWIPQVKACFESEFPAVQDLHVTTSKGMNVAALCFDTSRFPYVVKNPAFGKTAGEGVQFEVPWREGTAIRTASRSDLVLMLSPLIKAPKIQILRGEVRFFVSSPDNAGHSYLQFLLIYYVVPLDSASITFPFHKCSAVLLNGDEVVADAFKLRISTPRAELAEKLRQTREQSLRRGGGPAFPQAYVNVRTVNEAMEPTEDEIVIRGSGKMQFVGEAPMLAASIGNWPEVSIRITLIEAVTESQTTLNVKMVKCSPNPDEFFWVKYPFEN